MSPQSPSEHRVGTKWLCFLQAAILLLAGLWVFSPALHGDWLWDDDRYLTANPLLNDPARLWKIWFAPGGLDEYYPLLATIQYGQWSLWGDNTFGYHLTNLLLHLLSALLIWHLFRKLGIHFAWLGGLLFAIHPMTVESVAWIAEFKNTLSLPPLLLAACCYLDYDELRITNPSRARIFHRFAMSLFLVALLCKISVAPFPLLIVLYVWWKRQRIDLGDLRAVAPFFAIAVTLGLLSLWAGIRYAQIHPLLQAGARPENFPGQFALAGLACAFFFSHSVWPVGLLPIYAPWPIHPLAIATFLPGLIMVGIVGWCWFRRKGWGRHALLGLGFFLIFLLPPIGLVLAKYPALVWSLDHLGYISLIGIIGLAVAGLQKLDQVMPVILRPGLYIVLTVAAISLALESHGYAALFTDQKTLWIYTLEQNPQARQGLGTLAPENPRH